MEDLDTFLEMHEFELHLSCSHFSPRFVEDFSPFLQHLLHVDTSTSSLGMTLDSSSSVVNFAHPGAFRSVKRKKHLPPRELTYPTWRKGKIIFSVEDWREDPLTVLPKFMGKMLGTRWFKVTFSSPSWRSLNHSKGSFNHPKKGTKNCQVCCFFLQGFFSGGNHPGSAEFRAKPDMAMECCDSHSLKVGPKVLDEQEALAPFNYLEDQLPYCWWQPEIWLYNQLRLVV